MICPAALGWCLVLAPTNHNAKVAPGRSVHSPANRADVCPPSDPNWPDCTATTRAVSFAESPPRGQVDAFEIHCSDSIQPPQVLNATGEELRTEFVESARRDLMRLPESLWRHPRNAGEEHGARLNVVGGRADTRNLASTENGRLGCGRPVGRPREIRESRGRSTSGRRFRVVATFPAWEGRVGSSDDQHTVKLTLSQPTSAKETCRAGGGIPGFRVRAVDRRSRGAPRNLALRRA